MQKIKNILLEVLEVALDVSKQAGIIVVWFGLCGIITFFLMTKVVVPLLIYFDILL